MINENYNLEYTKGNNKNIEQKWFASCSCLPLNTGMENTLSLSNCYV